MQKTWKKWALINWLKVMQIKLCDVNFGNAFFRQMCQSQPLIRVAMISSHGGFFLFIRWTISMSCVWKVGLVVVGNFSRRSITNETIRRNYVTTSNTQHFFPSSIQSNPCNQTKICKILSLTTGLQVELFAHFIPSSVQNLKHSTVFAHNHTKQRFHGLVNIKAQHKLLWNKMEISTHFVYIFLLFILLWLRKCTSIKGKCVFVASFPYTGSSLILFRRAIKLPHRKNYFRVKFFCTMNNNYYFSGSHSGRWFSTRKINKKIHILFFKNSKLPCCCFYFWTLLTI